MPPTLSNPTMRILECYAGNLYGGIERQLVMFARERGDDNPLGRSFALCFQGRLSEELEATSAEVRWMGGVRLSRPWTVLAARRKLKDLLDTGNYDMVICHAMWPLLVFGPAIRKARLPLCIWAHDTPDRVRWIDRLAINSKPDLVIANSRFTQEYWTRFHPSIRCKVQYFPIPEPDHGDPKEIRARVRGELDTSADESVIFIAARFEEWKGHRVLLQALAALKGRQSWKCWIAGGAQRDHEKLAVEALKKYAEELGIADRVQWLGSRSDVFDLMLSADIYCQPNIAGEPFGVVFVEAMLARLPIVTSNMGGPAEFIDSESGLMTSAGDVAQVADALTKLIENPELRARLGAHAKERALQMFDLETNIKSLNQTLRQVIADFRQKHKVPKVLTTDHTDGHG